MTLGTSSLSKGYFNYLLLSSQMNLVVLNSYNSIGVLRSITAQLIFKTLSRALMEKKYEHFPSHQ